MARISKHPLQPSEVSKLTDQLAHTIARLTTANSKKCLDELLGPEEKLMLAKRLAAIVMYAEGYSSYRVWQTLNISPVTANTIRTRFEEGRYESLRKLFVKHKSDYRKLLKIIETIAGAGLPPLVGPGRWGNLSPMRGTRSKRKSY